MTKQKQTDVDRYTEMYKFSLRLKANADKGGDSKQKKRASECVERAKKLLDRALLDHGNDLALGKSTS